MDYKDAIDLFKNDNIELTKEKYDKFLKYENMLLEYNNHINLTSIVDDKEIWIKHFYDSCVVLKYINSNDSIIDVGTGAGFPGIPLKILNENIKLTLLDSLNKRVNFLKNVCDELVLEDVSCFHGRAEVYGKNNHYREQFDVAVARAVANLSTLAEYCLPFVKVGGVFICMKGSNYKDELKNSDNAISTLGGKIESINEIVLPEIKDKRAIIVIKKISNISDAYPRNEGIPSKKPL